MGAESDGPLLTLARRLRSLGPPSISVLIARVGEAQEYEDFAALVRGFLSECEREILGHSTPVGQMAAFMSRFQDRYFTLGEWVLDMAEGYSDFTHQIPVQIMGISWDDYHTIPTDYRPGLQLMTYVLEDPYEEEEGARVALAEACAEDVSPELLERVPPGGLTVAQAHRLLEGTSYAGLMHWGDVLVQDTGTHFFDMTDEEVSYYPLWWDRETVEELTRQWALADRIHQSIMQLAEWLEEDPPAHLGEMLAFIEKRRDESCSEERR